MLIATVRQGETVTINVLDNDNGQNLVLTTISPAWTGVTSISGNNMTYRASSTSFTGNIKAWYGVTDASGEEHWAEVTITVTN